MAEIQGENALDARREIARVACVSFADMSSLPKSPNPPKSGFGKIVGAVGGALAAVGGAVLAVGGTVLIPFTGGLTASATVAGVGLLAGGVGLAAAGLSGSDKANGADGGAQRELVGSKQLNQWNYKETITSTFEWETLKCTKCTRSQNCTNKKNPLFGSKYCKSWAEPVEKCTETQF